MIPAFYTYRDGLFVPQPPAIGNAISAHHNRASIAGLLASLLCDQPEAAMQFARLTIDFMADAPITPLTGTAELIRNGVRLQLIEARLMAENRLIARGTALRVRLEDAPDAVVSTFALEAIGSPPHTAEPIELCGPADGVTHWWRCGAQIVAGRAAHPLARAAMIATAHPAATTALDLSIYLTRPPEGEWLHWAMQDGEASSPVPLLCTRLADENGAFALARQTLAATGNNGA